MTHPIASTLESLKYWAGQRLLHSPLHGVYLKLSGSEPSVHTYEEWLAAEATGRGPAAELPAGYRVVLPEGAQLSTDAGYWLSKAAAETNADVLYADEDVMGVDGRRSDPIFKPAWSPELYEHCDYLGGCCLIREGVADVAGGEVVHIPRVLFHRRTPAVYCQSNASTGRSSSSLVSVVICSRNVELASECLRAMQSTTAYEHYEVVLVDHRARMPDQPGVKVVPYEGEFNFARMCNLGARASGGALLLFLNDDTAPLDPEWMGLMAGQAERPDVGAVGALLTYPDRRIQHAGIYVGTSNGAGHPGRLSNGSPIWPWLTMTREQSAVTGACLMTRREVFNELGGFDELFPVNYNDVDFCLRSKQAGYRVILEARARLEHRESVSRKTGIRYGERRRFLDRWGNVIEKGDPYLNPNLTDNELLLPEPGAASRVVLWR